MDTSGSPLLLTVKKGDKIFSVRRKGVKQEKLLFPALESLLAKAGAQMEDIGQIFIIRGPGRFTGIRISLTFASMMQFLNKTQVRGATMFEVLPAKQKSPVLLPLGKSKIPRGPWLWFCTRLEKNTFCRFLMRKSKDRLGCPARSY